MPVLTLFSDYRRLMTAPWQSRARLESFQQERLAALAIHAAQRVPYYQKLFREAGLRGDFAPGFELERLPVTTKAELREHRLDQQLASGITTQGLRSEKSSGSTGTPFTVYFDARYYRTRSLIFLRALVAAGYQPGQRLLLITDSTGKPPKRWLTWHYASIQDSPRQLAERYRQVRPQIVYGCTTALRLLAEELANRPGWRPRVVITTAEGLDGPTRRLLTAGFQSPVQDFYGLSEMGLIAWQCPESGGYHLAEDLVKAEFLPAPGIPGLYRLVLTNLEQQVMPFLRYDTGDLCLPLHHPCSCGRTFSLVQHFAGRELDCITLANGTKVSPYLITCALEKLEGLRRFQLRQEELHRFLLILESPAGDRPGLGHQARQLLQPLLGAEAEVKVRMVDAFDPGPRKFRVVESWLGKSPASCDPGQGRRTGTL